MARVIGERPTPKILHLAVRIEKGDGIAERVLIEERLNKAKDWFRYVPFCWLIYTSKNAVHWANVLRSVEGIKENTTFLICEVNLNNRDGWLQDTAWQWIRKKRDLMTGQAEL
jgi:hypothetical protein